jgi:carbon-monoxide dehydrogenase medium subunit
MAGDLADRPVRTMGTIGGALCAADPRFDMVTLVIGVGARLEVLSPSGLRLVQPHEFFRASGGTSLRPNEILTAIHFPSSEAFTAVAFEKFRQRTFDAAVISVLCALRVSDDGTVSEARLAVGSATPVPTLGSECAARLVGRPINDIDPAAVGDGVCNEVLDQRAGGSSLVQYQRELIRALTRKAFIRATITGRS